MESRAAKFTQPRWAFVGLVVAAVLLVPTLALGWSALQASDVTGTRESLGTVRSEVDVDYVARAPKSRVYPTGVVKTERTPAGAVLPANPLYVELVRSIDVTADFDAVMTGAARDGAQPAYTVDVRVSTPEGWTERLDSVGPKKFEDSTRETIKLNIPAIRTRVAEVGRLTGVGGDQFTITVTPGLRVTGETEAGRIRERVAPRLEFTANGEVIKAEPFVKTATEKDLSRTNLRPARFSIGVADLDVAQARALLGGLALLLVAAIAVFAAVLFGGVGLQGADRIAARYRSQVVDVAAVAAPPGPVVLVSSIDELARIARSEQSVILHENLGDGTHRYRVFLGAVTYEFQTVPEHAGHASSRSSTDREET